MSISRSEVVTAFIHLFVHSSVHSIPYLLFLKMKKNCPKNKRMYLPIAVSCVPRRTCFNLLTTTRISNINLSTSGLVLWFCASPMSHQLEGVLWPHSDHICKSITHF